MQSSSTECFQSYVEAWRNKSKSFRFADLANCIEVMSAKAKLFATLILVVIIVVLALIFYGATQGKTDCYRCKSTSPRGEPGRCVFLRKCRPLLEIHKRNNVSLNESYFFYSHRCSGKSDGKPLVSSLSTTSKKLPRPPSDCGLDSPNRIFGGTETALGEFSWTALLVAEDTDGYKSTYCGATLINSRYVVTAAHCIKLVLTNWTL